MFMWLLKESRQGHYIIDDECCILQGIDAGGIV